MTYAVKEIYYTLQGEGIQTGRPAVFLRFAGCNLWTGREADRAKGLGGCSSWCDTDFVGTDGPNGGSFAAPEALAATVASQWPTGKGEPWVVCTGGEPLLQLDEPLIDALHREGFQVAIESNGTRPLPRGVDWVCISPKAGAHRVVTQGHELKLVFPQEDLMPDTLEGSSFQYFMLQPLDGPQQAEHTVAALAYCLAHPQWRLSLQTHKYLNIP